jgi:ATP-dependent RNA helicase RhlB
MKFTDFTLDSGLQEGLAEAGYITCMPVQEQVLQNGLEGADLYVQSQTGTGKTAAYLVTILQRLASDPSLSGKKALIMVPTRELAVQVEEEARILGSCMKLKSASFYGGVGYGGQQDLLKKGVDIIIGTPGRVIDLQESRTMDLSQVAFLVIDEADRMFDMGFYPDLRTLIKVLPKAEERQTMLFSATLNISVKNLAWEYTIDPKEITIEAENVTVDEIDQLLFHVSSDHKMKLLLGILAKEKPESLIVFCNTKRMSEVVAKRLKINGYEADFIIGDLPQSKRLQVIDSFKSGSLRMLVATDVAARGIDVDSLAMVINYDLPNEAENYVHRIGRTARAGKTGKAYSFCSEQDVYNLPAIERYVENKVPSCVPGEDDFAEDKSANVYIRTDRYDSDYDDGDGERGGYRGRGASSGRGRPGASRGSHDGRGGQGRSGGSRDGRGGRSSSGDGRRTRDGDFAPRTGEALQRDAAPRRDDATREAAGPRRDGQRRSDGRYAGQNRGGYRGDTASRNDDRDLSKLSFEERMAYYKSKYGSDEAAKAAESQREAATAAQGSRSEGKPQGARQDGRHQGRNGNRNDGNTPRESISKSGTKIRDASRPRDDARKDDRQGGKPRQGASGGQNRQQGGSRPANQRPAGQQQPNRKPGEARKPNDARRPPARPAQGAKPVAQGQSAAATSKPTGGIGGFFKKLFGGDKKK